MESAVRLFILLITIVGLAGNFVEGKANFLLGKYIGSRRGAPPHPGNLVRDFPDQYFRQQLDHFNEADLRTWPQRFWDNDKYHKPGGPVFVMIGGEGPENPIWMAQGQWITWAKQFHALCLMLEHRFYGKSHPTSDLSVGNLKYLSSKQALADLANFVTKQLEDRNITNSKVIVFGGSYPGGLSAWFRSKYPHIVHAAVSSSAPLVAQENFSEYAVVVKKSLARSSPLCVDNVQAANIELENALKSQDSAVRLKDLFQLCAPVDVSNKKDLQNLVETLTGNFEDIVQYNRDNRRSPTTNITIDTLCGIMVDESADSALERYARVNKLLLNVTDPKCLNHTYASFLDSIGETKWTNESSAGGRQWTYQTCTEFGYYQTSDACDHPFARMFPLKFFVDQCQDLFGLNETVIQNGIAETNRYYGKRDLEISRVVFVNGDIDPWHVLGITKRHGPEAPAILIKGAAHCADMYPSREEDIPELKLARVVIEFFLRKWI